MIRNLKVLGLALVAMLAMSAVAASAASAQQGKLTADGPVTLKATETGGELANGLTAFGTTVICPGSTLTGHGVLTQAQTETGDKHGLITVPATAVTITPHYNQENCTAIKGGTLFDATVEMNGCDYVLTTGSTTGGAGTYGVKADIVCPAGKQIHVGLWSHNSSHESGRLCTVEVSAQTDKTGAHLKHTNTGGADDIDIEGTFTGIHVTRHGLCLLDGGGTTDAAGSFATDATIKGFAGAEETPVTITD